MAIPKLTNNDYKISRIGCYSIKLYKKLWLQPPARFIFISMPCWHDTINLNNQIKMKSRMSSSMLHTANNLWNKPLIAWHRKTSVEDMCGIYWFHTIIIVSRITNKDLLSNFGSKLSLLWQQNLHLCKAPSLNSVSVWRLFPFR